MYIESMIEKGEERRMYIRDKYFGPHAGPPAHLPPPRLAVFMSAMHAPPAGPKQPPKQPNNPPPPLNNPTLDGPVTTA